MVQPPERKNAEQAQIVQTFGQRMKFARELCGYNQLVASNLLGYANSSKLNKIEHASDGVTFPWWLPVRAASVYQVSTDFLYGISDDWEHDPALSHPRQIQAILEQLTAGDHDVIRNLYKQLSTVEKAAKHSLKRSAEMNSLVNQFRAVNPEFDGMKLGAKLLRVADAANTEAGIIGLELARYHSSTQSKSSFFSP